MDKLVEFRNQIEQIDAEIAELFVKRMKVCAEIGLYKKENNLPIFDGKREEELREINVQKVDKQYQKGYEKLFDLILSLSKDVQL